MSKEKLLNSFKKYHFEFRHLTVLLVVLVVFQIILSLIQKSSLQRFLEQTQELYQRDAAERIADLTATSLELLLENINLTNELSESKETRIIQSFNIIFSQQLLQKDVKQIYLMLIKDDKIHVLDDGASLYNFLINRLDKIPEQNIKYQKAVELFDSRKDELKASEQIISIFENDQAFYILVPFILNGEYLGALYMKNTPDFTIITKEIVSGYDEVAIIYTSLILLGLLAMYYISSYTVKERDEAQQKLFVEHEKHLTEQIVHEKESLFTKRIYHTHHKAEKVMGFIKEDLRELSENNIEEVKERVARYSNFISRVIYDMKWYDPPIQTIRNQVFNTDINEVLKFIVKNIFLRISISTDIFDFKLTLDEKLPEVHINEFVLWEIFEPLIQNCIDHAGVNNIRIDLETKYDSQSNMSKVFIRDNGMGINPALLETDANGIKKIFGENISTRESENQNTGYGCYIAYQIATKRCGWKLDVQNLPDLGSEYELTF